MLTLSPRQHLLLVSAKYGLTAFATAELAGWLVPQDRLSAAFVALLCCQPSMVGGLRRGAEQLLASLLGVASTLVLLSVFPGQAWTIGGAIALTYGFATVLRWPFATQVVALFSSLYMTLLMQQTALGTAVLRCWSVLVGVGVALLINLAFAPLTARANVQTRLRECLGLVRAELDALQVGVAGRSPEALAAIVTRFEGIFRAFGELRQELAELQEDRGLARPLDRGGREALYLAERSLQELERVLHHAVDVGGAVSRLIEEAPPDSARMIEITGRSLGEARVAMALLEAGKANEAAALTAGELEALRELDRELKPPTDVASRLGPRLVVLVGLAELHGHLEQLARVQEREQALQTEGPRAATTIVTTGGSYDA